MMIRLMLAFACLAALDATAQTRIHADQIEDAFLRKAGGSLFGDVSAATSTIEAATVEFPGDLEVFYIRRDGGLSVIRSNLNIVLDPTNQGQTSGVIVPAAMMEFDDFLGDKIRFYSHSFKIGVSPLDLDITSDQNIRFHSDETDDLMVIEGEAGDVTVKNNLTVGGLLQLQVVDALPAGVLGQLVYLDHPADPAQDGVYVYNAAGWQKL